MGDLLSFPGRGPRKPWSRRPKLPPVWAPYARKRAFSFAQLRTTVWAGLLLGLVAFQAQRLASAPYPSALPPVADGAPQIDPREVRVIDGDTFDYGGGRVRVADIDTPETHPPRCAYEGELGERATRRMRALLMQGPFELHPLPSGRDEDRYGRKLRIVTRGGQSLGDVLVAEGLARTWSGRREPWC